MLLNLEIGVVATVIFLGVGQEIVRNLIGLRKVQMYANDVQKLNQQDLQRVRKTLLGCFFFLLCFKKGV